MKESKIKHDSIKIFTQQVGVELELMRQREMGGALTSDELVIQVPRDRYKVLLEVAYKKLIEMSSE